MAEYRSDEFSLRNCAVSPPREGCEWGLMRAHAQTILHLQGVKQVSVLSPLLFLIAVDPLLITLRCKHTGLTIHGNFVGEAAHVDYCLLCCRASRHNLLASFISRNHLKLNRLLRSPIAPRDESLFSFNIDIIRSVLELHAQAIVDP